MDADMLGPVRRLGLVSLAGMALIGLPFATASRVVRMEGTQKITRPRSAVGQGQRFLIVATRPPTYGQIVEILDPTGHVQRVVATPGLQQSFGARWSPDGSLLAWAGRDGVLVERADGTHRRLLVRKPAGCSHTCAPL